MRWVIPAREFDARKTDARKTDAADADLQATYKQVIGLWMGRIKGGKGERMGFSRRDRDGTHVSGPGLVGLNNWPDETTGAGCRFRCHSSPMDHDCLFKTQQADMKRQPDGRCLGSAA
jgi:hypothetical protein